MVYFYNETHVLVKAHIKQNNYRLEILMSTGGHGNRFVNTDGDNNCFPEGKVRVRIWLQKDLPELCLIRSGYHWI